MKVLAYFHTLLQGLIDFEETLNITYIFRYVLQSFQGHSVHSQCFTFDLNRLTLGNDFKSAGTGDHR